MTPEEFDELHRALAGWPVAAGDDGVRAALATIVRTRGSTFRRTGARMLVRADGTVVRGLSGGCPEQDIIGHARRVIASGQSRIVRYHRDSGFDVMMEMGCGGEL
jgi:xanthine dehydrogenase accessory factor